MLAISCYAWVRKPFSFLEGLWQFCTFTVSNPETLLLSLLLGICVLSKPLNCKELWKPPDVASSMVNYDRKPPCYIPF